MKIVFMKKDALDYFKTNLEKLYTNYFTKPDNKWMAIEYKSECFEDFIEIPDFELADPDAYERLEKGEMDLANCKLIYENLKMLTDSQAADERLWAGICNSVFYDYLKKRWNNYELHNAQKDIGEIRKRFFFSGGIRSGIYGNSLARCWWIGKATYDASRANPFEKLDIIGGKDFSTKTMAMFCSYNFSANPKILNGIVEAIRVMNDNHIELVIKKDLRPALKYLNAVGGSILLDALSSDEIKDIVLRKMLELKKGIDTNIDLDAEDSTDLVDPDYESEEIETESPSIGVIDDILDSLEEETEEYYVSYGDIVIVKRMDSDSLLPPYQIPISKEEMEKPNHPAIILSLLGKTVGKQFRVAGNMKDWFEIVEIQKGTWD